jgi:hydroxysqualene synthase
MSGAEELRSGKGHRDENFPVASLLIKPEHRAPILAFYEFVRTADDIADHPTLEPGEKLAHLGALEDGLLGRSEDGPVAQRLRTILSERQLPARHAQDLLTAFRMDVTKLRYRNWDELIEYCRYSAMPVGRFVLDVHGESQETWPANDALCAALQINNHLQDCRADYAALDRVYVPLDFLAEAGAKVEDLGAQQSSPALRQCLKAVADRTEALLRQSNGFSAMIGDFRLSLEVAVITAMAWRILGMIKARDPLSQNVHLSKFGAMRCALAGMATGSLARFARGGTASRKTRNA